MNARLNNLFIGIVFLFLSFNLNGQIYIMGDSSGTITTCSGSIENPGGFGSYSNELHVTQTICSGNIGQCISLNFSSFKTEAIFDCLSIYDGPDTTYEQTAIYSGISQSASIVSSTNSGGCLTLVFNTNGDSISEGFTASVSCEICHKQYYNYSEFCLDAQQLCLSQNQQVISGSTGISSQFGMPGNVGCLNSSYNPSWFYFQVQDSGDINIRIESSSDADFICWGPFNQTQWISGVCSYVLDPVWANDPTHIVDCSYSIDNIEFFSIPNAQTGEYYMLFITDQDDSFINSNTINQYGGQGTVNCNSICDFFITTDVEPCDSSNNTYSISNSLFIPSSPLQGTLSIINSSGGYLYFEAPFTDTLNFSFDHLASDGLEHAIEISYLNSEYCKDTFNYTAPLPCISCAVSATLLDSVSCTGFPIQFQATYVEGANYNWSGPNGFNSTEQNPIIQNAEIEMSGIYQLDVYNPIDSCHSVALVNVLVHPYPNDFSILINPSFCSNDTLVLGLPLYSNALYKWTILGEYYSSNPMLILDPITQDGFYSCTVNIEGCINSIEPFHLNNIHLYYFPELIFNTSNNVLSTHYDASLNFQWNLDSVPIAGQSQSTLLLTIPGNYSAIITNDYGCSITTDTFYFDPTGIKDLYSSKLALQPNPATDFVQFTMVEAGQLEIHDLTGKLLSKLPIKAGTQTISTASFSRGVYLLTFHSNKTISTARLLLIGN